MFSREHWWCIGFIGNDGVKKQGNKGLISNTTILYVATHATYPTKHTLHVSHITDETLVSSRPIGFLTKHKHLVLPAYVDI